MAETTQSQNGGVTWRTLTIHGPDALPPESVLAPWPQSPAKKQQQQSTVATATHVDVLLLMLQHMCDESTYALIEQRNALKARREGRTLATARNTLALALGFLSAVSLIGPAIDVRSTDNSDAKAGDEAQLVLLSLICVVSVISAFLGYWGDDSMHTLSEEQSTALTTRAESTGDTVHAMFDAVGCPVDDDDGFRKLREAVQILKDEVGLARPSRTAMERIAPLAVALALILSVPLTAGLILPCWYFCARNRMESEVEEPAASEAAAPRSPTITIAVPQTRPPTLAAGLAGASTAAPDFGEEEEYSVEEPAAAGAAAGEPLSIVVPLQTLSPRARLSVLRTAAAKPAEEEEKTQPRRAAAVWNAGMSRPVSGPPHVDLDLRGLLR